MIANSHSIQEVPGLHRLFLDYCNNAESVRPFYGVGDWRANVWQHRPKLPAHRPELLSLLAAQNGDVPALDALRQGAGVMVTGQQVGLFGGPLFTPFKAATALARAREATAAGHPHVAIFWLATEDHDFAEINHVVYPSRNQFHKLVYQQAPKVPVPVGNVVFDESILPLVDQAWELLGHSEAMEALAEAYQPGKSFAAAFAHFYAKAFAAQGLLLLDASGREAHRLGAPVLAAAIERADEFHAALIERNQQLEAAGYHAQVAVGTQSSLLFLIDEKSGERQSLKRLPKNAEEPEGIWQTSGQSVRRRYSTSELLGILASEPERISPSALLRPVFQDFLLATTATVGGPAEVAYFAQSAVLFERILGRQTPILPRFSATLIEPLMGDLLRKYDLALEQLFSLGNSAALAKLLATRAIPEEGRVRLASAGAALEAELQPLLDWMQQLDAGVGRSAETAASKMRYQMNRMKNLAANFAYQREAALGRTAESLSSALYPGGILQERLHGAAYYFARYGFQLAEEITRQAADFRAGHRAIQL